MHREETASKYDAYYYAHCCGTPYVRGGAIWDFFSNIADKIVAEIDPRTVLDAGCAKGFLVELLRERGVEAWGFDISEHAISEVAPEVKPYCWVSSVTEPLSRDYDLIVCQEILEHIPSEQANQAIANLCEHTSNILFSSSPLDFTEPTHINVHPVDFWVEHFTRHGFFRDPDFDASFISPWAMRLRKTKEPLPHVIGAYERRLWQLLQEAQALRETGLHQQGQLAEKEKENRCLKDRVETQQGQIANLNQAVMAYQKSMSWRITLPFRIIGNQIRRVKQCLLFLVGMFSNLGELKRIAVKAVRVYRHEGMGAVNHRLKSLQSDQCAKKMIEYHGLSPDFFEKLKIFANLLLRLKQRWLRNNLCKRFSDRILNFLRGATEESRKLAQNSFRFHVDKPGIGLVKTARGPYVVSGWAVNLETRSAADVRVVIGNTVYHPHPKQRNDVRRMFDSMSEFPQFTGFSILIKLPTKGVHRMRIEMKAPDSSWVPIRRALLLCKPDTSRILRRMGAKQSYQSWTRFEQKRLRKSTPEIERHIGVMIHKPTFTVVIDANQGSLGLRDTIESIHKQLYRHSEIYALTSDCSESTPSLPSNVKTLKNTSLSDIHGDFVVFIQSGQRLATNALYEFASAVNQYPDIDLIYGDEDFFSERGKRHTPFYKPDWSPDYIETFNYIGLPSCFRASLAQSCFEKPHIYDFVLRFTECTSKVLHVPKILGHSPERFRAEETVSADKVALDVAALSDRLSRTGRRGVVCEHELHKGCYNIRLSLKNFPLVSIIIPTAGKTISMDGRKIDLIANVVCQIRERSTYKNIEIVVIDNGDLSADQIRLLAEADCRRVTYSDPVLNIPKKLNLGASFAQGEMLLLLNDDIEILTPSWIERLLEHFEKPNVGVVGTKLLYPDGKTQHVGVVHNSGNPDHVRRLFPGNEAGYFFSTCGVRNYASVTGACMMTRASLYREVGGYSDNLAVSYNDVDYCMKVNKKGFWVVYAPSAELTHMESQSRVASADVGEVAWYHRQWAAQIISDKFYNERFLTVASPTFEPCINKRLL